MTDRLYIALPYAFVAVGLVTSWGFAIREIRDALRERKNHDR